MAKDRIPTALCPKKGFDFAPAGPAPAMNPAPPPADPAGPPPGTPLKVTGMRLTELVPKEGRSGMPFCALAVNADGRAAKTKPLADIRD